MWHYLTPEDYQTIIKPIKNKKLKYQLYSQYKSRIPMLKTAYERLKKEYR
jgi:hypothetical protein